jgi:hypothetical protein
MRLEYALKRLEWAAHKILRESDLAADLPPDITALQHQALDGAVPGAVGVATLRLKTLELIELQNT